MQETLQNPDPREKSKLSPLSVLAAILVLAFLVTGIVLFLREPETRLSPSSQTSQASAITAEEAAYAKTVRIDNVALSRAENFLHQEVTILDADAVNAGTRAVEALSVTVEFADTLNQVVLRETRPALGTPPSTLAPGQSRHFQISFDRVPASWNMQQPSVHVSYLHFASLK
ncbi:MAG TPA: hypothetical protein VKB48_04745 [Candidatus Acidoferrum sp.]|nr:hypothetical protein [Candidatus Acidoferrum sp.]